MYKSRFALWALIAAIWIIMTTLFPFIKSGIEDIKVDIQNKNSRPDIVSFSSEDKILRRRLNELNTTFTTQIMSVSSSGDIMLNKGKTATEGYLQKQLYSPIVAYTHYENYDEIFTDIYSGDRVIRALNLKETINGFLNDLPFKDFYPMSGNSGSLKKKVPNIYVDESLENEIKLTMVMALAEKTEITEEDIKQHIDTVNKVWDEAIKLNDVNDFMERDMDDAIVLTAEYKKPDNAINYPFTLTNTVAVEYTLEYKEEVEFALTKKFIKKLGIRSDEIINMHKGNYFDKADWTVSYKLNTELQDLTKFLTKELAKNELDAKISTEESSVEDSSVLQLAEIHADNDVYLSKENVEKDSKIKFASTPILLVIYGFVLILIAAIPSKFF